MNSDQVDDNLSHGLPIPEDDEHVPPSVTVPPSIFYDHALMQFSEVSPVSLIIYTKYLSLLTFFLFLKELPKFYCECDFISIDIYNFILFNIFLEQIKLTKIKV